MSRSLREGLAYGAAICCVRCDECDSERPEPCVQFVPGYPIGSGSVSLCLRSCWPSLVRDVAKKVPA